jgi:Family of unknown function (DUF6512)
MKQKSWQWELLGIPFIVIVGSLLHFTFAWSGYWPPVALVAAVNESVWEHLKLAFWPGLVWAAVVYVILRPSATQFWSARGYTLLIAPLLIVSIFYTYTAIAGRNFLGLDIATFIIAVVAGQIGSAALANAPRLATYAIAAGMTLLVSQLVAYSTFTYYPPQLSLFADSRDGVRGIPTTGTR